MEPDRLRFGACRPDAAFFVLAGLLPLSFASFAFFCTSVKDWRASFGIIFIGISRNFLQIRTYKDLVIFCKNIIVAYIYIILFI